MAKIAQFAEFRNAGDWYFGDASAQLLSNENIFPFPRSKINTLLSGKSPRTQM
jgi:hypothetical protein